MTELCKTDDVPSRLSHGRIWVVGGGDFHYSNQYTLRGLQMADAYLGLYPHRELDYDSIAAWRAASVEWVLRKWVIAEAEPIPGALPEVSLVPRAELTADPRSDLAEIDLKTTALVDVPVVIVNRRDAVPGEALILSKRNGEYRVKTSTDSAQLLVVSTSYHRGWKAEIDGVRARVVRANGDFLGCAVPAGEHEIHLTWRSASHRAGRIVSAAALVLLTISLILPAGLTLRRDHGRPAMKNGHEDEKVIDAKDCVDSRILRPGHP